MMFSHGPAKLRLSPEREPPIKGNRPLGGTVQTRFRNYARRLRMPASVKCWPGEPCAFKFQSHFQTCGSAKYFYHMRFSEGRLPLVQVEPRGRSWPLQRSELHSHPL